MTFGVPVNPAVGSYYSNVTGFISGKAQMYNLTSLREPFKILPIEISSSSSTSEQTPLDTPSWFTSAAEYIKDLNTTDATERISLWNYTASTEVAFRVLERKNEFELEDETLSDISLMHVRSSL